jgi:hypothetical protein
MWTQTKIERERTRDMVTGQATPQLTGPDTVRGAIDTIEQYFDNGWTDGLPIVPPTEELVHSMSAASGRDPLEVVGVVPHLRQAKTCKLRKPLTDIS